MFFLKKHLQQLEHKIQGGRKLGKLREFEKLSISQGKTQGNLTFIEKT